MRSTNPRRILRQSWMISIIISISIFAINGTVRLASGTVRGGGAYISGAAMETNGVASTGSYLALTHRRGDISGPLDFVKLAVGLDITVDPKTPEQYRTVEGAKQAEVSRQIGGEVDLDQAADAAWAAAHSIAEIDLPGVSSVLVISSVQPETSAMSEHGISVGDRILEVNGEPATARTWRTHIEQGFDMFGTRAYGRDVKLVVGSTERITTVVLPVTVRGVRDGMSEYDIQLEGTVGIEINEITRLAEPRPNLIVPERVTGPSAGLVHTLVYLDALTDGDLTGGLRIAATGTVNSVGRVGAIGAVDHKAMAADAADADVMFVPITNKSLAVKHAGSVHVVAVNHANDAVRWLCQHGGVSIACYTTWVGGPIVGIPAGYEHLEMELSERSQRQADLTKVTGPR